MIMPQIRSLALGVTALIVLFGLIHSLNPTSSSHGLQAFQKFDSFDSETATRPVRLKKVSAIFGEHNYLYEAALQTHERHNELHGYEMQILRERIINSFWSKPAFLLSIIVDELAKPAEDRNDWLVWVEPATIVLNPQIPLELFLPPAHESEIHMVSTHDHKDELNSGVFFLRVDPWALRMLIQVLAVPLTDNHDLGLAKDQSALGAVLESSQFRGRTVYQPRRWFNALHADGSFEGRPGDLLVHVPEVSGNKWTAMDQYLGNVTKKPNPHEMKLSETPYEGEVAAFWERMREGRELLDAGSDKQGNEGVSEALQRLQFVMDYQTDHRSVMADAFAQMRSLL